METNEEKKAMSYFKRKLFEKIEETLKRKRNCEEFQDVHWDDVYDVYYDSGN